MRRDTGLWADVRELSESVAATIDAADGFDETAALLSGAGVRRIVASGNGAAYYVAHALWLAASGAKAGGPEVVAVPSGLIAESATTSVLVREGEHVRVTPHGWLDIRLG